MTPSRSPLLGFFAPMLGRHGQVPDVFESLAQGLLDRGYPVITSSSSLSRLGRGIDQLRVLQREHSHLDVAFIHIYSGPSFAIADAVSARARMAGVPLIGYLSGGNLPDFGKSHPHWVRRVLSRFDLLNAPSGFLADWTRSLGIDCLDVPNPLELSAYPFHERTTFRPRMLWLRTFEDIYRPELAVRVLADVRRRHPDAQLTMGGRDRGLLAPTQALAAELGVTDAVDFAGFIGPEAKQVALAEHDIYLHTNHIDNMPISLLEAAASGMPIVGSAVGGIPHLLRDREDALLAPDGDLPGLVERVERLLADQDLAARLARSARAVAERSDRPVVLDRWEELIAEVIAKRKSSR